MNTTSLLDNAGDGDPIAWRRIMGDYGPHIRNSLRRQGASRDEVEEVHQEVQYRLVKLLMNKTKRFRLDRARGNFLAYVRTVASRCLIDLRRRQRVVGRVNLALARPEDLVDERGDPTQEWIQADDRRSALAAALAAVEKEVPPQMVRAFRLHALEGRTVAEVAAELGVHKGFVYRSKFIVKKRLRERLEGGRA
jgi:RNA polymerase sigma factor (sigma-70 family)